MRWLLTLLLALTFATGLSAQERRATVELEDGTVLKGRVLQMDVRQIVLDVDGRTETITTQQIRHCQIEKSGIDPRAAAQTPETAAAGDSGDLRRHLLLMQRLKVVEQRFPWMVPPGPMQWFSLGVLLFVFLAFGLHVATRVVGSEATFGRSGLFATWIFVTGVAQLAFVPATGAAMFAVVLGNGSIAILLLRAMFALSFPGACMAILVLSIETAVGYGIIELIDATLLSIGHFGT